MHLLGNYFASQILPQPTPGCWCGGAVAIWLSVGVKKNAVLNLLLIAFKSLRNHVGPLKYKEKRKKRITLSPEQFI